MEDRIDHLIRSALVWGIRVSLLTQDIGTSGRVPAGLGTICSAAAAGLNPATLSTPAPAWSGGTRPC